MVAIYNKKHMQLNKWYLFSRIKIQKKTKTHYKILRQNLIIHSLSSDLFLFV